MPGVAALKRRCTDPTCHVNLLSAAHIMLDHMCYGDVSSYCRSRAELGRKATATKFGDPSKWPGWGDVTLDYRGEHQPASV